MKIRIMGKPEEIKEAVKELEKMFDIISVSNPYANRNSIECRVYVEAEIRKTDISV